MTPNEKPASTTTTAKGVTEAMVERALAVWFETNEPWYGGMANDVIEGCSKQMRSALEAALSLPAPGEGEAADGSNKAWWIEEREDDALLVAHHWNFGKTCVARRPKLMTNEEWRPIARQIIAGIEALSVSSGGLAVKALDAKFHDRAKEKLKLWFFRDMSDEQRLKLFSLFGLPADEIGKSHGHQSIALKHVLSALDRTTLPAAEGWQTMDSAPKAGGKFLAYEKGRYFDCWWHENGHGEAYWMDEADSEPNPSHWHTLPSAPNGAR